MYWKVVYALATDEVERIGVDYVARISMAGSDQPSSITAEHLLGNYQATQMLYTRLHLIRAYVSAVSDGELPINRARLREISALIKRLPLLSSRSANLTTDAFGGITEMSDHLYRQANDVCLTSLLSSITQGIHSLYSCVCKTAQIIDRRPMPIVPSVGVLGMNPPNSLSKMPQFMGNTMASMFWLHHINRSTG
ncbi:unnamed protein product [Dicrocoelium dendriticum]|nr:unnamed protein product [Dicrocoelium dendriticum]